MHDSATAHATHCLKAGEVIANVPHAVYTAQMRVKAIDAWSPVMERYLPDESRGADA